jgi:Phosphotransferase enzyme family
MMVRRAWDDLPASVREAVEARTGPVHRTEIPAAGRNSDFSATLHVTDGLVFCKGIADGRGRRATMHRHEAEVNSWLFVAAPNLRWRIEVDDWLLLGFDHVPGRYADLSPGSSDLSLIADTVTTMAREMKDCPLRAPRLADQWGRLVAWRRLAKITPRDLDPWALRHLDHLIEWEARAIELVDGGSLVHTDLHPLNILVGEGRAHIIDWAWSRLGAAAADPALLIPRLVAAGHSPTGAERWATTMPVWRETSSATRTAFAMAIWGMWEFLERDHPLPHRAELTAAVRQWAHHRLGVE